MQAVEDEEGGEAAEAGQLALTITMAAHTCSRSTHGWRPSPPPAAASGECDLALRAEVGVVFYVVKK